MNKKSGSCLTTRHQENRVCLYNKTVIPFALVVDELIYTTRAHGITVKYIYIYIYIYKLGYIVSNTYKVLDIEIGTASYKNLTSNVLCYSELHARCDHQGPVV